MFRAHVESTVAASHSNGPPGHRCRGEDDEGHGHDWRIEAEWSYQGVMLNEYGWGLDFGAVKRIFQELDHRNLNRMFNFPPSAENIAVYLHQRIMRLALDVRLVQDLVITIHEGGGNLIVYRQED